MGNPTYMNFSDTEWSRLGDNAAWGIAFVPRPSDDGDPTPLSVRIFNAYNIPISTNSVQLNKGTLPGYDLENADAIAVIKMSLLEELNNDPPRLVEVYVNANGEAEFIEVGAEKFNPGQYDVRYSIPTRRLINKVEQVAITGFNPPPLVYVRGPYNLLEEYDSKGERIKTILDPLNELVNDTCYEEFFKRYALIMYRTPILRSEWKDTLDSLYNVQAFERIIGWITKIEAEGVDENTEIIFSDITLYPYEIDLEDYKYKTFPAHYVEPEFDSVNSKCDVDYSYINFPRQDALKIELDTYIDPETGQEKSDFISVDNVFVIGWPCVITDWSAFPMGGLQVNLTGNREAVRITENLDYVWTIDDDGNPLISFIIRDKKVKVCSAYNCPPEHYYFGPLANYSMGVTNWVVTEVDENNNPKEIVYFNYHGEYGWAWQFNSRVYPKGTLMFISKIIVVLRRHKSSITIYDPSGGADEIANSMKYELYPIIECDPPAPICGAGKFNGVVDHTSCLYDHDPTTFENLVECDSNRLQEALSGPSISMTLPFLNGVEIDVNKASGEESVVTYLDSNSSPLCKIANYIYDLVNYDELSEVTYILGPEAEPKLGQQFGDGIINSISYSYQDSSNYLITITTGSKFIDSGTSFSDSSIWTMDVESITREGVVTQVAGNGIHYVVHVNGLGDYIAVNTIFNQMPPEVGDRVTIEINNVPKGWR